MKALISEDVKTIGIEHKVSGVRIGTITDINDKGRVLVDFSGNLFGPVEAKVSGSMGIKLGNGHLSIKDRVILIFENDDPQLPIILDTILNSTEELVKKETITFQIDETKDLLIEGKRIALNSQQEIVLRSGKSSITLTKAGKVIIRGSYILNRSSGVNRIKGGSVQIN